ncbi:MAG: hypothetical protein LBW85_02740 [Deltaproteobacteria bacterium]|nr:hypothetical protein [Deltaproteobacteria bacterium]
MAAGCRGPNGYGPESWKAELQNPSEFIWAPVKAGHSPPAPGRRDKAGRGLLPFLPSDWRGEPSLDRETAAGLVSHSYSRQGLTAKCGLDHGKYGPGPSGSRQDFVPLVLPPENAVADGITR